MRITSTAACDTSAAGSARHDIVVEIHTDQGISGVGEPDVNPWIARARTEAPAPHNIGLGLREMLIGSDPLEVESVWDKCYLGSARNSRRGAVINATGASRSSREDADMHEVLAEIRCRLKRRRAEPALARGTHTQRPLARSGCPVEGIGARVGDGGRPWSP